MVTGKFVSMASSSECIASSVIADQATLEQIREEEASFYGTSEEAVDSDMPASDDDSDEVFLSEDEAQSRRSITSMRTPSGSVAPGPSTTSQIDDTEVASEFEKGVWM